MVQKIKQRLLAPNLSDGFSLPINEAGSGVTIKNEHLSVKRARLTISGATLSIAAADDFGSLKLCDLPDRNLMLLGVEVDLVLTKEANTDGVVAATDLDVGVGTAAASATTLATTMIDIIEKADLDTNAAAVDFHAHSNDQSTATFPKRIADSATAALFLNAVAVGGIEADSSLTVDGTVDIFYVDLGNLSS